ncbi:MAG TPA: DUF2490 domain-containing protein [Gammaproteobacteria bacterium]|jgi:hypothetical protein
MNRLSRLAGAAGLFLLLPAFSGLAYAERDTQAWIAADKKLWNSEKAALYFYTEMRLSDGESGVQQYYYGPRFNYRLSENWSAGGALKSINIRNTGEFDELHRLEAELTYSGRAGETGKVDLRNRVELIRADGKPDLTRYRHRLRYKKPLGNGGVIKSFFISDEIIYAEDSGSYHLLQNRLVPFGLDIDAGAGAVLSLYYQYVYRNNIGRENDKAHVLGATLNF